MDLLNKKVEEALCNCIKSNNIAKKYLDMAHWLSGSSTMVYPITFWRASRQIEIQWKIGCPKRDAERFISQILKQNCWLDKGIFRKLDGSCPDTITFYW